MQNMCERNDPVYTMVMWEQIYAILITDRFVEVKVGN